MDVNSQSNILDRLGILDLTVAPVSVTKGLDQYFPTPSLTESESISAFLLTSNSDVKYFHDKHQGWLFF
jgi:hypothetical protein